MRYLGGKYRIAKHIAREINRVRNGRPIWDAFCGGLSISGAVGGQVYASDTNAALIALYDAVANGWDPPNLVTESDYEAAKLLPDSDPMRAFCGFGCSFAGKWFAGKAASRAAYPGGPLYSMESSSRNSLLKDVPRITAFACCSFFCIPPGPENLVLYLDPPYRGTAGYGEPFDHDAFEGRALEWSKFCPVFVSEYAFPYGREVWAASKPNGSACFANKIERLFLVGG